MSRYVVRVVGPSGFERYVWRATRVVDDINRATCYPHPSGARAAMQRFQPRAEALGLVASIADLRNFKYRPVLHRGHFPRQTTKGDVTMRTTTIRRLDSSGDTAHTFDLADAKAKADAKALFNRLHGEGRVAFAVNRKDAQGAALPDRKLASFAEAETEAETVFIPRIQGG